MLCLNVSSRSAEIVPKEFWAATVGSYVTFSRARAVYHLKRKEKEIAKDATEMVSSGIG
jgi:hypothetical protein